MVFEESDTVGGNADPRPAFYIGAFYVEPSRNRLSHDRGDASLEPRVMDVLCLLAENGEHVTTRKELIERLWPVEFGADDGLTRAVSSLRRAIRDAGESDTYVETIPKRGYRLVQAVTAAERPTTRTADSTETVPTSQPQPVPDLREPARAQRRTSIPAGPAILLIAVIAAALAWIGLGDRVENPAARPIATKAPDTPSAPIITEPSIAVLPFRPLSDNPADVYFGDGIAEEVQHLLERIRNVRVVARTSAFAFRDLTVDVSEVGDQLAADFILRGSVRHDRDRIRVSAQLIRTGDGEHLWSETFDRDLSDVFAVQDAITVSIVGALQIRLGTGFTESLKVSSDVDPRAIDLFYEALHLWSNRFEGQSDMRAPFDALRAAVDIDERFAAAWALMGYFGTISDASPAANDREAYSVMTQQALDRALSLEPDNGLAHVGMAAWHLQNTHRIETARYHLDRARALQPNALTTLSARAAFAWLLGDPGEALRLLRQMKQLDPLNREVDLSRSTLLAQVGQFDEAFLFLDDCQATSCLGAGFITFAATAAFLSDDPARLAQWKPVALEFLDLLERVPAARKPKSASLLPAVFAEWFDLSDKDAQMAAAVELLRQDPITDYIGVWGPSLARYAPPDLIIDLLELAFERGDLLSAPYAMAPFYGFHPYPDTLLAMPRYQRLWQREGLRDIAALRREAGYDHGLPIGDI
ncbi:MAG: winged helix-turn-helix domain-containing protein [Pseudomonadota bacterium]